MPRGAFGTDGIGVGPRTYGAAHGVTRATIEDYRAEVLRGTETDGSRTAVELGTTLWHTALLASATEQRPWRDERLWGVGLANLDKVRDGILRNGDLHGLAGADIITGWPGRGQMWRHWYRLGAKILGQPTYHTNLIFIAMLESARALGATRFLTVGRGEETGGAFWPPLAHRGERRFRSPIRGIHRTIGSSASRPLWRPGPLLTQAAVNDLRLDEMAVAQQEIQLTAAKSTGYLGFGPDHFNARAQERLTARLMLGEYFGIRVEAPLHRSAVIRALLKVPRQANSIDGQPGAVLAEAFAGGGSGPVDWNARRRPGEEIAKTPREAEGNWRARTIYLRDSLHPQLAELIDMRKLERVLNGDSSALISSARPGTPEFGRDQRRASVEFAHIEAVNHWLEVWEI